MQHFVIEKMNLKSQKSRVKRSKMAAGTFKEPLKNRIKSKGTEDHKISGFPMFSKNERSGGWRGGGANDLSFVMEGIDNTG
jgi:hypothetical protein